MKFSLTNQQEVSLLIHVVEYLARKFRSAEKASGVSGDEISAEFIDDQNERWVLTLKRVRGTE